MHQSQFRLSILFLFLALAIASFAFETRAAFGDLDTTYSSDGMFTDTLEYSPTGVARQSDGKILIAGFIQHEGDIYRTFILRRYSASGGLDPSFGWNSNALPYNAYGDGIAIYVQSDDKIVVAGMFVISASSWKPAVWRFNPDGTYDSSFGTKGRVLLNSNDNAAFDVVGFRASRADPLYLYVATTDNKVYCLNSNGTLKTSFGSGGSFTGSVDPTLPGALSVKSTGIYVSGRTNNFTSAVSRHNLNGQVDTTWGNNGVVDADAFTALSCQYDTPNLFQTTDPSKINEENGPAVFQSNGLPVIKVWRKVIEGQYLVEGSVSFLARLTANGSFDAGFNDSCSQGPLPWTSPVYDRKLLNVFADNRLVEVTRDSSNHFFVRRYTATGLPDGSFEADLVNVVTRLLPLSDGRLVVVGTYDNGTDTKVRITRHLP